MIRLDASDRQAAVAAGWAAYAERVPGAQDAYLRAVDGWDVLAVKDDAKTIGALFAKDGVIHLGIVPEARGKWASRRVIREMLAHGGRTTYTTGDDASFLQRVRRIACHS